MQQRVRYACGDTRMIHLVSSSPRTRQDILQHLQRSSCPACQRRSRYEDARWRAEVDRLTCEQVGQLLLRLLGTH